MVVHHYRSNSGFHRERFAWERVLGVERCDDSRAPAERRRHPHSVHDQNAAAAAAVAEEAEDSCCCGRREVVDHSKCHHHVPMLNCGVANIDGAPDDDDDDGAMQCVRDHCC